jgi:hypothetical protein
MSQQNINDIVTVNDETIKTWTGVIRGAYLPHLRIQKRELLDELEGLKFKLYPTTEDGTFQKIEDQLTLCEKAKLFYELHIASDVIEDEEEYFD